MNTRLDATWKDAPLADVVAELKRATSIPLEIDQECWSNQKLDLDPKVSLELGNSTAMFALNQLCKQLNVSWTVEYGAVRLIDRASNDERMSSRIYNVSKLTKWLEQNGLDKLSDDELRGLTEQSATPDQSPPEKPASENQSAIPSVVLRRRVDRTLLAEHLIATVIQENTSGKWELVDAEGAPFNSGRAA